MGLARGVLDFLSIKFCAAAQFDLHTAMRPFNLLSGGEMARAQVAYLLTEARRCVHSLVPSLFPYDKRRHGSTTNCRCASAPVFQRGLTVGAKTLRSSLRILSIFRGPGIDEWPFAVGHRCFDVARFMIIQFRPTLKTRVARHVPQFLFVPERSTCRCLLPQASLTSRACHNLTVT